MQQAVELPLSWYGSTVEREVYAVLDAHIEADVCVIGGGLAGLTTAHELARLCKSVVLLEAGRAVLPVATHIAVTAPVQQDVVRTTSAIADTRRAGDYYRLIGGDRILWGGRITTQQPEPRQLADVMLRDMKRCYPKLPNPTIDFAWSGIMGYALHKMPLIGRDSEGQWFATGFGGHGLNTTAMAGELIAQAIARDDETYKRFVAFPPRYAFGPLGRLGVQSSYWWMQMRDRFDETFK